MLVLTRSHKEAVRIGQDIVVTLCGVSVDMAQLEVLALPGVTVAVSDAAMPVGPKAVGRLYQWHVDLHLGETVHIGDDIHVTLVHVTCAPNGKPNRAKLGFVAPLQTRIFRQELCQPDSK